jgi:hypothetical protein
MISVELNTALKSKFIALGAPYNNIKFFPLSAYQETEAPFIVYTQFDGTRSEEQFFLSIANVIYTVYDNDISRMKDVVYEMDNFLNVGDHVGEIKSLLYTPYSGTSSLSDLRYRIEGVRRVGGSPLPPLEREGFSSYAVNYRVVYLNASGTIS